MTRVFLSSPYSHPSPAVMEDRVRIAGDACAWLYHEGYLPMSPIVHWHHVAIRNGLPDNALAWTEWNRRWLEASDALAVLQIEGWQDSTGLAMECSWARSAGIPIVWMEPSENSFAVTRRDISETSSMNDTTVRKGQ